MSHILCAVLINHMYLLLTHTSGTRLRCRLSKGMDYTQLWKQTQHINAAFTWISYYSNSWHIPNCWFPYTIYHHKSCYFDEKCNMSTTLMGASVSHPRLLIISPTLSISQGKLLVPSRACCYYLLFFISFGENFEEALLPLNFRGSFASLWGENFQEA
jgi:hypothetical protein